MAHEHKLNSVITIDQTLTLFLNPISIHDDHQLSFNSKNLTIIFQQFQLFIILKFENTKYYINMINVSILLL